MAICTKKGAAICLKYALYRVHIKCYNEVQKGADIMAISYQGAFDKMQEKCVTTYRIRKENILSQSTLQKMRDGKYVTTETIERLCLLLDCTPNDLMKITK